MSYSFQVRNGDLNLGGPSGFATVTGTQKVFQDLQSWILSPMGSDTSHPEYGSVVDGGLMPDGTIVNSTIGTINDPAKMLDVETEVRRILQAYQTQQLNRLKSDTIKYNGKNTFAPGELIYSIQSIDATQLADTILVGVTLLTTDGATIQLTQPVGA